MDNLRPLNSHSFGVRLKLLGQISHSHELQTPQISLFLVSSLTLLTLVILTSQGGGGLKLSIYYKLYIYMQLLILHVVHCDLTGFTSKIWQLRVASLVKTSRAAVLSSKISTKICS